jgi:hypothetical protein
VDPSAADRPAPGQGGTPLGPVVAVDASAASLNSTGVAGPFDVVAG